MAKKGGVTPRYIAFLAVFWRGGKWTLFKNTKKNSNQKIHLLKGPRETQGGGQYTFLRYLGSVLGPKPSGEG